MFRDQFDSVESAGDGVHVLPEFSLVGQLHGHSQVLRVGMDLHLLERDTVSDHLPDGRFRAQRHDTGRAGRIVAEHRRAGSVSEPFCDPVAVVVGTDVERDEHRTGPVVLLRDVRDRERSVDLCHESGQRRIRLDMEGETRRAARQQRVALPDRADGVVDGHAEFRESLDLLFGHPPWTVDVDLYRTETGGLVDNRYRDDGVVPRFRPRSRHHTPEQTATRSVTDTDDRVS